MARSAVSALGSILFGMLSFSGITYLKTREVVCSNLSDGFLCFVLV